MVIGEMSLKNLADQLPLPIMLGSQHRWGWSPTEFSGADQYSLGVLNLLPIPLLDGGHLLYYMAELIKGSPMSEEAWEAGQKIGIVLLVTLMVLACLTTLAAYFR